MMEMVAEAQEESVLCGVTAHPLFVDKASALRSLCGDEARVAVLVGYDTWVRIIDPKYYGGKAGLDAALKQIFDAVEVMVASREESSVGGGGSAAEQEAVVNSLPAELTRQRLHFVHNSPEMAPLSSSAIRKAISADPKAGGEAAKAGAAAGGESSLDARVREMLPECLHAYVEGQHLYRE